MVQLRSSRSEVTIAFTGIDENHFRVSVVAGDHSVARQVYAHEDGQGIARLFEEAAREWTGWDGRKIWESMEGELRLELSIDRLGHVRLEIRICSNPQGPDPWEHHAELTLDAGQLERIASDLKQAWSGGG